MAGKRATKAPAEEEAPKRRRGHNEGTIVERVNPNTGKVRYQAQVLVNGKRRTETHANKKDAQKWIRDTLSKADEGFLPEKTKITVAQYLDNWLAVTTPTIRPRTVEQYNGIVRLHIKPSLGTFKLAALRPDHVEKLKADKLASDLSPRTVQLILSIFHHALDYAVKKNLVARNVVDVVTPPKVRRKEMKTWTPEEVRRFLSGMSGHRWEALYVMALSCGLRAGELLGLRWEDIDLERNRMSIRRTLQRLKEGQGIQVGEPKTARGRRQIILPLQVVASLKRWQKMQVEESYLAGDRWKETGYVFTTRVGTPAEHRNLHHDFTEQVERLDLPKIRLHDLRHTCATMLLSQGVHPKIVQEMLGHSQISLTLDTYSHVLPTMQEEAAQVMTRMLNAS